MSSGPEHKRIRGNREKRLTSFFLRRKNKVVYISDVIGDYLVQTAITEYQRLNFLKNRHLFLTVLKTEKFKIRVQHGQVIGKGPPPGSQVAIVLLCPHMEESE